MPRTHMRSYRERGLRLRGHDYRSADVYFVTIVTAGRECRFGRVIDGRMELSEAGRAVVACWLLITQLVPGTKLGEFVVMPNHIHVLIQLPERDLSPPTSLRRGLRAGSLGSIMGGFKSAVTRRLALPPRTLWQTRFYDRVVRDQRELEAIESYIALNPERWRQDPVNPESDVPLPLRDGAHCIRKPSAPR